MQKQISAIISLKDKFSQPLLKMSDNVKKLDQETRSSMNRVNRWGKQVEKSVDRALKSTAKWAKRGAILAAGWSVKSGIEQLAELDDASRKVKSIARDRLEMDDIRQTIKDFKYEWGVAFEDSGDALYNAISSSVPIDLIKETTLLSHKMSKAGFTNIDDAMKLLATTGNAFSKNTKEGYKNMADQFLKTQELGVIEVGDMAHLYGGINTLSRSIGASLEEQNAAVATMTAVGMTQSEAVTSYKNILNAFLKPVSDTTAAALDNLGLGADFLTAKNFKKLGFGKAMEEVMKATGGDLDKISDIFKDIRGKTGATIFTGDGLDRYKNIYEQILDPTGSLDNAFEVVEGSISNQWKLLKEKMSAINTEFYDSGEYGQFLAEGLKKANKWLEGNKDDILKKVGEISDKVAETIIKIFNIIKENKDAIKLFLQFVAAIYALVKISKGLKKASKNIKDLKTVLKGLKAGDLAKGLDLKGLGMVAAIIILLGQAIKYLYDNWDDIREEYPAIDKITKSFEWLFDKINGADFGEFDNALDWLKNIVETTFGEIIRVLAINIVGFLSIVSGLVQTVWGIIQVVIGFFRGLVTGDFTMMKDGFEDISEGMTDAWQGFTSSFTETVEAVINIADDVFFDKVEKMKESWRKFKEFIQAPVSTTVKFIKENIDNNAERKSRLSGNYKGTPNWRGGITKVHERGGEIMDLPRGTRIYPHDRSIDMAFEEGASLNSSNGNSGDTYIDLGGVHFNGDIKTDGDINEIGTKIVTVIKKELGNI